MFIGFMNTGDPEGVVRGNMGLKDQNMALRVCFHKSLNYMSV